MLPRKCGLAEQPNAVGFCKFRKESTSSISSSVAAPRVIRVFLCRHGAANKYQVLFQTHECLNLFTAVEFLNVVRVSVNGWNDSERGDTPLNDSARSGRPSTTRNSEGFGELGVRNRRMAPTLIDDPLQINRRQLSVSSWRPARRVSRPRAHFAMTFKALPRKSQSAGLFYPPHSPDLALADFSPFPKVQTAIKWRWFQDRPEHQEVRSRLTKCSFFRFLRWLMRIFYKRVHKYAAVISHYSGGGGGGNTFSYFLCIYSHNINLGMSLQHYYLQDAPIRNCTSWRRMMTPVNNELERRKKVGARGSIPGSSKGLLPLPQYPNRPNSSASFLSNG